MAHGADLMGRPKRGAKKSKAGQSPDDRVAIIHLKGTRAYKAWLDKVSDETLIPVASIVRDALAKWAKQRGYSEPPEL